MATSGRNNKWLEMKAARPALRQKYIDAGILPDPDKPRQLSQATQFVGTCLEMCPEFEREEREFQGEGDELEVYEGTTRLDPQLAVKIYRRPAAGRELPLPDDVRPPVVLKKTLDYLFHSLLPVSPGSESLANVQGFIWNRTRAIRQDFIVQGQAGALTVECHERIARWHILSLHWKGGSIDANGQPRTELPKDRDPWSEQQELEQLAKTLTSLNEFYDDLRLTTGKSNPSPNEAEFRAYHLILNLYDPEVLRSVENLPESIFDAEILQIAITLRAYVQRANRGGSSRANALNTDAPMNFFSRFFQLLKSPKVPYLLACICENKFIDVRQGALRSLCSNYNKAHRGPTATFVKDALGADSEVQVIEWAESYGIEVQMENDMTTASLKLHKSVDLLEAFKKASGTVTTTFSKNIVECKRGSWTSQQIVDGAGSGAAPLLAIEDDGKVLQKRNAAPPPSTTPVAPAKQAVKTTAKPAMSPFAASFTPGATSAPAMERPDKSTTPFGASVASASATTKVEPTAFPLPSSSSSQSLAQQKSATSSPPPTKTTPSPFSTIHQTTSHAPKPAPPGSAFGSLTSSFKPSPLATGSFGSSATPPAAPASDVSASRPAPGSSTAFAPGAPTRGDFTSSQAPASFPTKPPTDKPEETKQTAHPPRKPSYKIEDDTQARQVYQALVRQYAERIAREAVIQERQRRRREARQYFIETLSQRLYEQLRQETVERAVAASIAWPALADELRRRAQLTTSFDKWQDTLAQHIEAQKQKDRLEEVRREVQRRGLLDRQDVSRVVKGRSHSGAAQSLRTSLASTAAADDAAVEDELSASIRRGTAERASLWSPGSFSVAIAGHVANLISRFRPSEMGSWTACVSLPTVEETAASTASAWLKHKFDLHDEDGHGEEKRIPVAPQVDVRIRLSTSDASIESSNTALVIFCLSPNAQSGLTTTADLQRLASLTQQEQIVRSKYSARLLVLTWDSVDSNLVVEQLNLRKPPHVWKDIAIMQLNGVADPDAQLTAQIKSLVKDLSFNPRRQTVFFNEIVAPLRRPWSDALGNVHIVLQKLLRYVSVLGDGDDKDVCALKRQASQASLEALVTFVALANYGLEVVAANSETLFESSPDGTQSEIQLPRLSIDEIPIKDGQSPNAVLYRAGRVLVSKLHSLDGDRDDAHVTSSAMLAEAHISQAQLEGQPFPLSAFLEYASSSSLAYLESNWLSAQADEIEPVIQSESTKIEEWSIGLMDLFGRKARHVMDAIRRRQAKVQRGDGHRSNDDGQVGRKRKESSSDSARGSWKFSSSSDGTGSSDVDADGEPRLKSSRVGR